MDGCRCAFENNGRFLAFLTPDGRLKVWDCTTGSLKYEYTPPSHLSTTCTCLQWSRTSRTKQATPRKKKQKTVKNHTNYEGDSIALGTSSGDVLVYNVSAGEINQRLEGGHDNRVNDICWSEDDTRLYSSSNDKYITEWNSEDGQTKCKWKADKHGVRCIRLGPQGHTLLSAGRSIKLWNLETKEALQKFTGHSSPVTHLLFVPSHLSHDTKSNHITSNGVNGHYFISGAEQDRVMNIWLVNLETDSKNALVSLSLTEEPISVHIARYSNCTKPVHIAVVSKDGQLHIFEYSLNGAGKKPLTPTKSIQLASSAKKDETPSPIPILCARLLSQGDPCVMFSFGSVVKPHFETLPYSTMERHTCLIREGTSNLLLKSASEHPFQVDKGQVLHNEVTVLGPGNLALPTPSVALDQGKTRTSSTTPNEKKSSLEDQSIEERLKSINAAASGIKRGKKADCPGAGSLIQMLVQALHSQDNTLMEDVLRNGGKESLMKNTIKRLPANLAVPLLTELVHKIQASPGRGEHLILWIQQIMSTHMAYLMTAPDLVESLSGLYAMMESRVSVFTKLCKLQGRLDLILSQVDSQNQTAVDEGELAEPSVVYQEEDSEEEPVFLREADHSESDENWEEEMPSKPELADEESEMNSEGEDKDEEIESDDDN